MIAVIYGHSVERISLIRALMADEGFSPETTQSADEVLSLVDRRQPLVVVLTDVDETGVALLTDLRVRADGAFTTVAVVVDKQDVVELDDSTEREIDLFLTAPVESTHLLRAQLGSLRRHAERAARRRRIDHERGQFENRYQLLFENSLDAIVIADAGQVIIEANQSAEDLLGYDLDGLPFDTVYADEESGAKFWQRLQREEFVENFDLGLVHQDGQRLQCRLSAAVQGQSSAGTTLYQVIIRDCTEKLSLRETIRDTEKRFRAIFNSTFQFVGLLDADGILLEANEPALEFAGVDREEVIGKPFWKTAWWAHSRKSQTRLRHAIERAARGQTVRFDTEHISAEGEVAAVDFSLTPVADETGEVAFIIPEGRDVTEQRRVEREMMALREQERRQIGRDLQEWLGQMLTGIRMISESLKRDLEREQSDVVNKADDILRFVQEADEFTHHLSRGILPVELDAQGLSTALRQLAEQSHEMYSIDCTYEEEGSVLVPDNTISTSLYWLAQEAIENAVSTGKASQVKITLMQTDRYLRLTVRDNGVAPSESVDVFMQKDRDLRLMQYRARLIGGFLDLAVPSSGGRLFTCTVPVENAADSAAGG